MAERRVTAATLRARQMMMGGVVLGHVVVFYGIGQALEVVASELEPTRGLVLVLVSYAVRVIGIAAGLWLLLGLPQVAPLVSPPWLVASVAGTVFAWVTGVVLVASRQRVPVYDAEYEPPDVQDGA